MNYKIILNDGKILYRSLSEEIDILYRILDEWLDNGLKDINKTIIYTKEEYTLTSDNIDKNLKIISPLITKKLREIQKRIKKITSTSHSLDMIYSAFVVHFIKINIDDIKHCMIVDIDDDFNDHFNNDILHRITCNCKLIISKDYLDDVYIKFISNTSPIEIYKR